MKNFEKYIDQLVAIIANAGISVDNEGNTVNCRNADCQACVFHECCGAYDGESEFRKFLLSEVEDMPGTEWLKKRFEQVE